MEPLWAKDITYLKRVGPQRAKALQQECGIYTYEDLLYYFPRKYVDRSRVSRIRDIRDESYVTLVGKITHIELVRSRKGRGRLVADFTDGTGFLELNWFQGIKWIQKSLKVGEEIAIFGKPSRYGSKWQLSHPEIDRLRQEEGAKHTLNIVPFYPSTEKLSRLGLDARGFRAIMYHLLEEAGRLIPENLSPAIRSHYRLMDRPEAMRQIHFPDSYRHLQAAQRRLKFEEFFFFQLMLARRRTNTRIHHRSHPFTHIGRYFNDFFAHHLPFELTKAQKRVLKEIRKDLSQPVQMNRLVQGDVGSGKTMVAFMSMLMAKDNGFQSALMAPTAILAEQHYKKISRHAQKLGMQVGLLVGGQKKADRSEVLEGLQNGQLDIAIGTHALIEEPVQFQRLGLVVVDEQHKFGVMQRARLFQKADPFPHNLIMTATPIPRTLAMTLYGDVDVSVIDELPPGRKPIKTLVFGESKRLEVFGFIRKELQAGRQAYVVYPLVEESEKLDLLAAVKGHELLEKHFHDFRVGIVHGKMQPDAKEFEMQRFINRETHILVSTTVIEVGVDVPNANIILIENAERFGLSQLHQLRGRVGRGQQQAYCILMKGYKLSQDGKKRLTAMRETTDGFKIAEYDLQLRGPGDFLGTRQSGIPQFQLANLAEDQGILLEARQAAFDLNEADPRLNLPENQPIRSFYRRYGKRYAGISTVA
ncbi:MAG: ATP-dependent DNA helicase RecG [Bacteroidetes bacterium]|nr:MAG: ATP-dependent DNA helicase RecG [Bacteroidota bacterium]